MLQTDVVFQRIVAYLIDSLIYFILYVFLAIGAHFVGIEFFDFETSSGDNGFEITATNSNWVVWLSLALQILYKGGQEALYGKTLGKRLLNIEVRTTGGDPIGWQEAIVRNLILILPFTLVSGELGGLFALAGFVWLIAGAISMIASSQRQRLGDRAAGTIVIRKIDEAMIQRFQYATSNSPAPVQTVLDSESWYQCSRCRSQFQGKSALSAFWNGQYFPSCPQCGTLIDTGQGTMTASASEAHYSRNQ